jgi:hypothetical protein
MDTRQIICYLRDVGSFLGVFAYDMLPKYPTERSGTIIVNTDPHTEYESHWIAIHIQSRSSRLHYFYSYGLPPYIAANHSSTETALCGITTRYSYKALRHLYVANIAVSWRCIRLSLLASKIRWATWRRLFR